MKRPICFFNKISEGYRGLQQIRKESQNNPLAKKQR
jgi:hypothetical protein